MSKPEPYDPIVVQALCDAATPEPWESEERDGYITGHVTSKKHEYCGNTVARKDSVTDPSSMTADDSIFIAKSRTLLPAANRTIIALRAAVKAMLEDYEDGKTIPTFEVRQMCRNALAGVTPDTRDATIREQAARIGALAGLLEAANEVLEGGGADNLIKRIADALATPDAGDGGNSDG